MVQAFKFPYAMNTKNDISFIETILTAPLIFVQKVLSAFMSAAYIQAQFRIDFIMAANSMNLCLQYMLTQNNGDGSSRR